MHRFIRVALALFAWVPAFAGMTTAGQHPGIGRPATPAEVAAWDIDVRADFKGLPPGSGSVAKGQKVWDEKCASCHGTFGESNEVFTPLVGGTTAEDIKTGRTRTLKTGDVARTSLMKLSTLSTLWDYINRAMPWSAPKSLTTEEVYAVVAYLLNLGDIVPDDFVLSDANIAQVQERLPNRNGMTRKHGLWDVNGKPDVANVACMRNCATEVKLASVFPDSARGSHGDLAAQNRLVGPVRGNGHPMASVEVLAPAKAKGDGDSLELARRSACLSCHDLEKRLVGPSFKEIAARYRGQGGAELKLVEKLRGGGSGAWGPVPMPPNAGLAESDAQALVRWVLVQ